MTQSTEQELYEQWRESYALRDEPNYSVGTDHDCKAAFIAGMQAARRAQVVQSVAGIEGGVIRGEPTFAKPPAPPAAPQPAEAAPVQMPEPSVPYAIFDCHGFYEARATKSAAQSFCDHYNKRDADGGGSAPYTVQALYTEHQVRQLLAQHGIK